MNRLPTVTRAKEEIAQLQEFIRLAENHEEDTLSKQIIKRYAYTGSIVKVVAELNAEREQDGLLPIESDYVSEVIRSKPKDQLHRLVRTQYMKKTKHTRIRGY